VRAADSDRARCARDLERLALALAAHDPQRTMARGYALVQDRSETPLGSAAAARAARELTLRFHDGAVAAEVAGEEETE
jgi:exodeoxyribonuclease VII large subunit